VSGEQDGQLKSTDSDEAPETRHAFEAYPDARVLLLGGVGHRYDPATRQLVPASDEEQDMYEEQQRRAAAE
jgi:hypothetical protein